MIKIENLYKEFDTPTGTEVAVDGVNIEIDEGEFFTLVGPSGCGKTTTLRCVAGLESPTSGTIKIDGENVVGVPGSKRNISMMFQNIALYPHMTVSDNISYPLKVAGVSKTERRSSANEAAEMMQVSQDLMEKYPGELSGGQRQRAALARTVVKDPSLFLMDEPLSDLDAQLKIEIRKVIQQVHQNVRKPFMYVTHDQQEAMTMSDQIGVMKDGNIQQIGAPRDLYQHPNNRFVGEFIGNPRMNILTGEVDDQIGEDIQITVHNQSIEFEVDTTYNQNSNVDGEVLVGFRPEAAKIGVVEEDKIEGTIQLLEPLGNDTLATVDSQGQEIRATVSFDKSVNIRDKISISIRKDGIYLFDKDTEKTIGKGTESSFV